MGEAIRKAERSVYGSWMYLAGTVCAAVGTLWFSRGGIVFGAVLCLAWDVWKLRRVHTQTAGAPRG